MLPKRKRKKSLEIKMIIICPASLSNSCGVANNTNRYFAFSAQSLGEEELRMTEKPKGRHRGNAEE
jgi:hypothetical protein